MYFRAIFCQKHMYFRAHVLLKYLSFRDLRFIIWIIEDTVIMRRRGNGC